MWCNWSTSDTLMFINQLWIWKLWSYFPRIAALNSDFQNTFHHWFLWKIQNFLKNPLEFWWNYIFPFNIFLPTILFCTTNRLIFLHCWNTRRRQPTMSRIILIILFFLQNQYQGVQNEAFKVGTYSGGNRFEDILQISKKRWQEGQSTKFPPLKDRSQTYSCRCT